MKQDVWKRPIEDKPIDRYPEQLRIQFKYPDASPETIKKWNDTEGKWWADKSLTIVAIASCIQVFMLGMMLMTFKIIQMGVGS